jgi:hypothetical protein
MKNHKNTLTIGLVYSILATEIQSRVLQPHDQDIDLQISRNIRLK